MFILVSVTRRKQVESLVGCIVLTGQEAPENGRRIREDLYKKTMSADGLIAHTFSFAAADSLRCI
jgi:hypothetical protein